MASLLNSVNVVITYFVNWLSSLTISLISNPIIQLVFAIGIIFTIIRFILCLLIDITNKKSNTSKTSITYDGKTYDNDWEFIDQFEKNQWDNNSFL